MNRTFSPSSLDSGVKSPYYTYGACDQHFHTPFIPTHAAPVGNSMLATYLQKRTVGGDCHPIVISSKKTSVLYVCCDLVRDVCRTFQSFELQQVTFCFTQKNALQTAGQVWEMHVTYLFKNGFAQQEAHVAIAGIHLEHSSPVAGFNHAARCQRSVCSVKKVFVALPASVISFISCPCVG